MNNVAEELALWFVTRTWLHNGGRSFEGYFADAEASQVAAGE